MPVIRKCSFCGENAVREETVLLFEMYDSGIYAMCDKCRDHIRNGELFKMVYKERRTVNKEDVQL